MIIEIQEQGTYKKNAFILYSVSLQHCKIDLASSMICFLSESPT